jgi:peroxiredoxin
LLWTALVAPVAADPFRVQEMADAAGIEPYPFGLKAPPFRLPRLDGGRLESADLRGKVVLLSFWASWCAPCRAEFPAIERLQAAFPAGDFAVVGIAVADAPEAIRRFLGERPPPFAILLDADKKVAEAYQAGGIPVAYLLGRDGRIVAGKTGPHRWDDPATLAFIRHLIGTGGA